MNTSEYIRSLLLPGEDKWEKAIGEPDHLERVQPDVGPEVGRLLQLLIRQSKATRVLEIGTCLGYSTLWIAEALAETGGTVTTIDIRPDLHQEASRTISKCGLSNHVEFLLGDAVKILLSLSGPYDLILQDGAKDQYPLCLEDCIRLTRTGGWIVADDALFVPMGMAEKHARPIHQYNELVFSDQRLLTTILPIGDGVALSVKIDPGK